MNKSGLLILLVLGFKTLIAQSSTDSLHLSPQDSLHASYIINAKQYNRGIYKTFREFKFNAPSVVADDFYIDRNTLFMLDKTTGKAKRVNENEIWGYCDGEKVYHQFYKLDELVEIGRYCYFLEEGVAVTGIPPTPKHYKLQYILNFNTGKVYQLTDVLLKEILGHDDPEMLTEFKSRTKQQKVEGYLPVMQKYNSRNESRIK